MSDTSTIIVDLDGTLLDTSSRHYAVYQSIAQEFSLPLITFKEYWNLRREGADNISVLKQSELRESDCAQAESIWLEQIESIPFLKHDRVLPRVHEWLQSWSEDVHVTLATLRSQPETLQTQLAWYGLNACFSRILVIPHQPNPARAKADVVSQHVVDSIERWIGDSEVDMEAALMVGTTAIGVTSGMRSSRRLIEAGAVKVYESITHVPVF